MKRGVLILMTVGGAALAFAFMQAGVKVHLDGKPISSRAIVQNGTVYVPAADVAKALGKTFAYDAKTKTAKMGSGGGVFQANGVDGKAGETLFNGVTRLTVGKTFEPGTPYTMLDIEARNAENANKNYHFGYVDTRYTLFDANGQAVEGEMKNNDHYNVTLAQAEFRKIRISYRMPEGFVPTRLVIRLSTQVHGNNPRMEIFRVTF